ncbi:hypothetical protein AGOR_G00195240 [Albula goreensis]|uniref:C2H2-type domain-containing protein n=1 Tax=Albula goreensis TaxID=1534307 RepID=A0A8T3CRK0_9TELE|nr:hypothetical protein AGOR_G00195240 [Albula goreensis]
MSDAILTFQVQLSGVMETVLKSAMYEITRLVEDSFLEEVARSKQEVESLKQRLKWSESRRREREGGGRVRCADCGRAGVSSEETVNTHSGTQQEALELNTLGERVSDQQWSPDMRQDTAPPADALHPEQLSTRLSFPETSGLYVPESEHEQAIDRVRLARQRSARRRNDLDSDHVNWTAFKLTDSDNEIDGLDPSSSAELESASPSAQAEPPPGPAEEGAGHSASPLQYLNVKSEGGVADSVAIKEEAELQPVCREEIRLDVAHTHHRRPREPWDRGDVQVENTAHLTPSQDAMKRLQSFSEKVESLTLQFRQKQRHGQSLVPSLMSVSQSIPEVNTGSMDNAGCTSYDKGLGQAKNIQLHPRVPTAERPFSCTRCGKSFSRLPYLKEHLKTHTGEKPFSCIQCGRGFTKLSNLKAHRRVHTGERPYICTNCGKRFTLKSNLKRHQRIHTGERLFSYK